MTATSWTGTRLVALLVVSALVLANAVGLATTMPRLAVQGQIDFFTFLASANQVREGRSPYLVPRFVPAPSGSAPVHPNLNHPAGLLLFVPFLALAPAMAYALWAVVGLACYLLAIALALREVGAPALHWPGAFVLALSLAAPGVAYSLQLGQWGLPLALPVTVAWILYRHDRRVAAAALLGLLATLKPFLLLLLALVLPWQHGRRRWTVAMLAPLGAATLTASVVSLAVLPILGPSAYADWLVVLRAVNWYSHGFNISLVGLISRVAPPPPWLVGAITAVAGAGVATIARRQEGDIPRADRDVGLLLVLSLLVAPLGWLYYTALLVPLTAVAVTAWPRLPGWPRRLLLAAAPLLWAPHFLVPLLPAALWSQLTLRAAPTYGLVLVALALGLGPNRVAGREARPSPGELQASGLRDCPGR